jgi:hypothetical protein
LTRYILYITYLKKKQKNNYSSPNRHREINSYLELFEVFVPTYFQNSPEVQKINQAFCEAHLIFNLLSDLVKTKLFSFEKRLLFLSQRLRIRVKYASMHSYTLFVSDIIMAVYVICRISLLSYV